MSQKPTRLSSPKHGSLRVEGSFRLEDAEQAILDKVEHNSLTPRRKNDFWSRRSQLLDTPRIDMAMASIAKSPLRPKTTPFPKNRASMIMDMVHDRQPSFYNSLADIANPLGDDSEGSSSYDWEKHEEEEGDLLGEDLPLLNQHRSSVHNLKKHRSDRQRSDALCKVLHLLRKVIYWVVTSIFCTTLVVAIPCHIAAWVFYYHLGNPMLDFLPGHGSFAWWLNLLGKQCLVFELGRALQWMAVDWFAISTSIGPKFLGPFTVIVLAQAEGLVSSILIWGLLDVIILHGTNPFQLHWLYWTDIAIYSKDTSGDKILSSGEYTRFLLCLLVIGAAGVLKNTWLSLYFGRRYIANYRPQLEDILSDVIVISEIAELSAEASKLAEDDSGVSASDSLRVASDNLKKRQRSSEDLHSEKWQSVQFSRNASGSSRRQEPSAATPTALKLPVKRYLDHWSEPLNKADIERDISLEDIYKFQKALSYMDMMQPFSASFGMASTREECLASAEKVYNNLLRLCGDDRSVLDYGVLQRTTEAEDGTVDKDKAYTMKQLFRPDKNHKLSLVTFVQACDTVYKRIRFFRASVGNASIIDSVLEGLINGVFQGILFLLVLTILDINPWPLIVSLSTVLVTIAFAVGPSAAKLIEGVIMIVIQRPYDIGDRIVISDQPGKEVLDTEAAASSWFVEDISLFTTVIRYAPSNEIATLTNGSISKARIVNCARSKHAKINIPLSFHISIQEGDNLSRFRQEIQSYVADHNQAWKDILFLNCESIDASSEIVHYTLRMQSRRSWQGKETQNAGSPEEETISHVVLEAAVPILADRSALVQYCGKMAVKLGVQYEAPKPTQIMYLGGHLHDGAVKDYKAKLLDRDNLVPAQDSIFPIRMMK